MFHMSYFDAAPRGLDTSVGSLKQPERLLRDADASWVELVDLGCELLILGETSPSLGCIPRSRGDDPGGRPGQPRPSGPQITLTIHPQALP